jgi:hypothetical protein
MKKKPFLRFFIALSGYDGERFIVLMSGFAWRKKKFGR